MSQTSIAYPPERAYPGLKADAEVTDIISRIVSTQQLDEITINGNDDGTFSATVDGTTYSYVAASKTVEEIRDGLLTELESATEDISATAVSTDKILVESTSESAGFVMTVNSTGTPADISSTTLVAQGQQVPYGIGVVTDPQAAESGTQCRLPRLTGEVTAGTFLGISLGDVSYPNEDGSGYADKASVPIMRHGRIWVRTEDACVEGGQVFCRFQDPTADYGLGSFRSDADTADAVAVPGAQFLLDSGAGEMNVVELNPTR